MLRKLKLCYEFCVTSIEQCIKFFKSDPIEATGQIDFHSNYTQAKKSDIEFIQEQPIKIQRIGKMREEDIEKQQNVQVDLSGQNKLEDDHSLFEELKPQLSSMNFKAGMTDKHDTEKVPLRYQEEDVDATDAKWNDDDIEL